MTTGLFLAHIAATWLMVGIIWFVQIVHYPLFGWVGTVGFADYAQRHASLTTLVVAGPMLVEAFTGVLLLSYRPNWVPAWSVWVGLTFITVIWIATACFSIPQHHLLRAAFNPNAHQFLVASNWVRTAAWTIRGALMLWVL